jgi:glycosidase
VDAVWLSPIFTSPMEDGGYDVSDYTAVDPIFGTIADFEALVARAHDLGLRVVIDFVPNHTSHAHPWFIASRAARDADLRDWYIWRDPDADGGPRQRLDRGQHQGRLEDRVRLSRRRRDRADADRLRPWSACSAPPRDGIGGTR